MRAAIQISGEFRTIHLSYPSYCKYMIENLQAEGYTEIFVFVHCWDRKESSLGTFQFDGRGDWHKTMPVYSNETGLQVYQPIAYLFEDMSNIEFLQGRSRILCMYYSIFMANQLRKHFEQNTGIKMDLVIRYRTDLVFEDPLLKDKPNDSSFLVIPKSTLNLTCDGPFESTDDKHICDYIAYGTPDKMDIYCETFLTWLPIPQTFIGESCLAIHLALRGIKAIRRPIGFYLVEGNGQKRGVVSRSDFVEITA